jgi:MFS family permease
MDDRRLTVRRRAPIHYTARRLPDHDPYAALRVANFRRLILSYGLTTVAREAQIVVIGWQIFSLTHDPRSLGMVGLAEALPFIAVALYAGHVADRASRRTIALAGTFGMLLSAVALLLYTVWPHAFAHYGVWPVYAVIFLSGIARSFTRPALTALSAEVVERELYASSIAWRSSTWMFAAILGPALGGLLYGFAGPAVTYGVVVVLMAAALGGVGRIAHDVRPVAASDITVGESVRTGVLFIVRQPVVLAAMTLDLFSVLFGGVTALLPIFATMLSAGPQGLGVLRAAPAVGSLLMGLYLAHRPPMKRAGVALLAAVTLFGLTIIAFALSRNFWLSLALLVINGAADDISVVIRSTLVQTMTPSSMLGRVSSVNQIFIGASNEIGAFESGFAAWLMGTVPSVLFGGGMTLLVVAVTAVASKELRRMKTIEGSLVR